MVKRRGQRSKRDETPLLTFDAGSDSKRAERSDGVSDAVPLTKQRSNGFLNFLRGRSMSPKRSSSAAKIKSSRSKTPTMDTRTLKVEDILKQHQPEEEDSSTVTSSRLHKQRDMSPLPIPPSQKDSSKKLRPFGVPIRRRRRNSRAQDPPETGQSYDLEEDTSNTPNGTARTVNENIAKVITSTTAQNNRPQTYVKSQSSRSSPSAGDSSSSDNNNDNSPSSPSHVASHTQRDKPYDGHPSKARLKREFGRQHNPSNKVWVVEVSSPEWDETHWKYRILLQRRKLTIDNANKSAETSKTEKPKYQASSFTTAFCWRTVSDFGWLETALLREFAGALLIPRLELVLNKSPLDATAPLPAEPLKWWLSDIFNGVRGQGEVVLPYAAAEQGNLVLESESMEAFLYHAGELTDATRNGDIGAVGGADLSTTYNHNSPSRWSRQTASTASPSSRLSPLRTTIENSTVLKRLGHSLDVICGAGPNHGARGIVNEEDHTMASSPTGPPKVMRLGRFPPTAFNCSSQALATAPSLDVLDSLADQWTLPSSPDSDANSKSRGLHPSSSKLVIHSELVLAQSSLFQQYRKHAITSLGSLQMLLQREEDCGASWQRFAVSLINLFMYEKQVESAKIVGNGGKLSVPFKKISKKGVEDKMKRFAKARMERSVPALIGLQAMIASYTADLSAVEPGVYEYTRCISQINELPGDDSDDDDVNASTASSHHPLGRHSSWEDRLRHTVDGVTKQAIKTFGDYQSTGTEVADLAASKKAATAKRLELHRNHLMSNEQILRSSLSCLCGSTFDRTSRMAWRYYNTEASQCAVLQSAALSLAGELVPPNKDSVSRMIERHMIDEKQDAATEVDLVERLVNISVNLQAHRVKLGAIDGEDEIAFTQRREKAIQIAKERLGRWNAQLALAMMEAVGVDDPNVRVEETTRDLRLIRKHAIGLRENLNRCAETVEALKTNLKEEENLRELRVRVLSDLARLYSGQLSDHNGSSKANLPSLGLLKKAGAEFSDPFGWNAALAKPKTMVGSTGQVGIFAMAYTKLRETQTDWLVTSLSDLLDDYYKRVEAVESYVYMECVGIQLEKFFSRKRTDTLTRFEKRTDITSAMNIATRKNMTKLVKELEERLERLGPEVTHTLVKDTKDTHLASKVLKGELQQLANRRLTRVREASTERIVSIMAMWAKEEEGFATSELKAVGEAISELEKVVVEQRKSTLSGSEI